MKVKKDLKMKPQPKEVIEDLKMKPVLKLKIYNQTTIQVKRVKMTTLLKTRLIIHLLNQAVKMKIAT